MEQFQCGTFDTAFFSHFSTSMSMWTRSMDYNTRLIQVHRYFCNTSATGVKMRLRVQVLTGGWTDDSFIHMCGMRAFETFLDFG